MRKIPVRNVEQSHVPLQLVMNACNQMFMSDAAIRMVISRSRRLLIALLVSAIPVKNAIGNDGFGALGVGGINVEKTSDIAITSEQLDISYKEIRVLYQFRNESDHDIESTVSFPLPQYEAFPPEGGVISSGEPFGFSITVNGKPVKFQTRVETLFNGMDVTAHLKKLGLTDRQLMDMPFKIAESSRRDPISAVLTETQRNILKRERLCDEDGFPRWRIQVVYHWRQVFPAQSGIIVEHQYRPFIAEGTASGYEPGTKANSKFAREFCVDPSLLRRLDRIASEPGKMDAYNELPGTIVDYILTTATTWKDGIRQFTLRLHKATSQEIISLCFGGNFKKINDTTLESRNSNYSPKENLHIYFGNIGKYDSGNYGVPPR